MLLTSSTEGSFQCLLTRNVPNAHLLRRTGVGIPQREAWGSRERPPQRRGGDGVTCEVRQLISVGEIKVADKFSGDAEGGR